MKEMILFLYGYYEYYFILASSIFASLIMLYTKKNIITTIKDKCLCYTAALIIDFTVTILFRHNFWPTRTGMQEHIIAFLLENVIIFITTLILTYFILVTLKFLNRNFVRISFFNIIKKNQWGMLIFVYLSVSFFLHLPSGINKYCALWYATNYSMGIGSRFFIGSLISLLNKGYLNSKTAFLFCSITIILILILVSILINNLFKHSDIHFRGGLLFILLLFLSSPGSISALWQSDNFGRLETYGLLISLIVIILFEKIRNIYIKYIVLTILTCVSMAIYQGNVFMYYPIILMLFIYDNLFSTNHILVRRILSILNIIMTCGTFIFFQFFSYTKFNSVFDMFKALSAKTNLYISDTAIELELFQPVSVAFDTLNKGFLTGDELPREKSFFTFFLLLPLFVLVLAIYLKCRNYRRSQNISILKAPYIYYLLLTCSILPQFVLNVDWGRWIVSTVICILTGILYLLYKKDEGIIIALERLTVFVNTNKFLCLIILIFIAGLGKFNGREYIEEVNTLTQWLADHNFIHY